MLHMREIDSSSAAFIGTGINTKQIAAQPKPRGEALIHVERQGLAEQIDKSERAADSGYNRAKHVNGALAAFSKATQRLPLVVRKVTRGFSAVDRSRVSLRKS